MFKKYVDIRTFVPLIERRLVRELVRIDLETVEELQIIDIS